MSSLSLTIASTRSVLKRLEQYDNRLYLSQMCKGRKLENILFTVGVEEFVYEFSETEIIFEKKIHLHGYMLTLEKILQIYDTLSNGNEVRLYNCGYNRIIHTKPKKYDCIIKLNVTDYNKYENSPYNSRCGICRADIQMFRESLTFNEQREYIFPILTPPHNIEIIEKINILLKFLKQRCVSPVSSTFDTMEWKSSKECTLMGIPKYDTGRSIYKDAISIFEQAFIRKSMKELYGMLKTSTPLFAAIECKVDDLYLSIEESKDKLKKFIEFQTCHNKKKYRNFCGNLFKFLERNGKSSFFFLSGSEFSGKQEFADIVKNSVLVYGDIVQTGYGYNHVRLFNKRIIQWDNKSEFSYKDVWEYKFLKTSFLITSEYAYDFKFQWCSLFTCEFKRYDDLKKLTKKIHPFALYEIFNDLNFLK